MKKIILVSIALITMLQTYKAQNSFVEKDLETYINKGLQDWQLPGLALVIVKDGKVVVQKGFGVKNIVTKDAVDANTLFFIASNSKLFTGLSLANLEVEGKLKLNDKITKYYSNYKLYNPTMTSLVTIKDMLTHRIGTKTFQGDFTFWDTKLSREEIMNRMQYLKPENDFRDAYGYCNSCFLTAGMIIPKVTKLSWEDYVTQNLLHPLQMTSSTATSNGIEKREKNIATPYTTSFTNTLQPVPYDVWDNLGPAASIVSNVKDLTNWLQFQLDSGKYNGKQVMPWASLQKTRDVQISTGSRKSSFLPVHFRGYGLGLFSADYNGKQIYWHTGGAAGMVSNVCFVPEEKLGIAILTNNDNQSFFEMLRYQILDSYLGVPFINRSETVLPSFKEEMENQVKQVAQWKSEIIPQSKADLQQYIGEYKHQLYGTITVSYNEKEYLDIVFNTHPDLKATLQKLKNGEWLLTYSNIEFGIFTTNFVWEEKAVNPKTKTKLKQLKGLMIKANDFVEYDPYEFIKVK